MARVYSFESHRFNHDVLECLMRTMIKTRGAAKHRDTFHRTAAAVLSARGLYSMRFHDFVIYPRRGTVIPMVHIRARAHTTGNECPKCGISGYDNLVTIQIPREGPREDRVVWGCVRCCTVFSRVEQKGEDASESVGIATSQDD